MYILHFFQFHYTHNGYVFCLISVVSLCIMSSDSLILCLCCLQLLVGKSSDWRELFSCFSVELIYREYYSLFFQVFRIKSTDWWFKGLVSLNLINISQRHSEFSLTKQPIIHLIVQYYPFLIKLELSKCCVQIFMYIKMTYINSKTYFVTK